MMGRISSDIMMHQKQSENEVDDILKIKLYFFKLLRSLHWILFSVLLTLFSAYLYLQYSTSSYLSKASLLVKKGEPK